MDITKTKPTLDKNNIKLIGVGIEKLGIEEFVDGNFFGGDIYISKEKSTYSTFGFKRDSLFSVTKNLFSSSTKLLSSKADELGIKGNLKGDGLQNGGVVCFDSSGKIIYSYIQKNFSDHPDISDILGAFGISP